MHWEQKPPNYVLIQDEIFYSLIVACDVTAEANDTQQAVPMAQLTLACLEQAGIERPEDVEGVPRKIPGT